MIELGFNASTGGSAISFLAATDGAGRRRWRAKRYAIVEVQFDRCPILEFCGPEVISNAGLMPCRELLGALGLTGKGQ